MNELERVVFNYLPRICNHCLNPACVAACPSGAIYKRGRGWRGAGEREQVPGLAHVRGRLPVQEGLLQLVHRQVGEVHPVLPAPGDRPGAGLRALLRWAHPLHGRAALRRRPDPAARRWCRTTSWSKPSAQVILDPFDPEVLAAARANGIEDSWIERGAEFAGLQVCQRVGHWRCRCTPSTAPWR